MAQKNKDAQHEIEKKNEKKDRTYTIGFIIILFIFLFTVFLIITQPPYYHKTIILFSFGAVTIILMVILFSIFQKPVVPPSETQYTGINVEVEIGNDLDEDSENDLQETE